MAASRNKARPIKDLRQLRALASPLRQEIVDALEAEGPCSMRELAALVGRRPDALYYHVRVLRSAGLVVDVAPPGGSAKGRTVDLGVRPIVLHYDLASGPNRDAVCRIVGAMTRSAARHFRNAYEVGLAIPTGPRRDLWAVTCQGWLSESDVAEVNRLLGDIRSIMRRRHAPGDRVKKRRELTFVLTPLPRRESAV